MGCHILDPVFATLQLGPPVSVQSTGGIPNEHNWANDAVVRYTFRQTKYTQGPTVNMTWYDGDKRPPTEVTTAAIEGKSLPDQGSLFLGEEGALLLPHVKPPQLFPTEKFAGREMPKVTKINHYHQFLDAVRGDGTPSANFNYAGPLTESILLGGVATHFPQQSLEWDAANLRCTNVPAANRFLRRTYRKGWDVAGLS
jgi:hypothetical protein